MKFRRFNCYLLSPHLSFYLPISISLYIYQSFMYLYPSSSISDFLLIVTWKWTASPFLKLTLLFLLLSVCDLTSFYTLLSTNKGHTFSQTTCTLIAWVRGYEWHYLNAVLEFNLDLTVLLKFNCVWKILTSSLVLQTPFWNFCRELAAKCSKFKWCYFYFLNQVILFFSVPLESSCPLFLSRMH